MLGVRAQHTHFWEGNPMQSPAVHSTMSDSLCPPLVRELGCLREGTPGSVVVARLGRDWWRESWFK